MESDAVKPENSLEEKIDLQVQKLKEVEQLLMKESGSWKCKECKKNSSLQIHAEIHINGFSFPPSGGGNINYYKKH